MLDASPHGSEVGEIRLLSLVYFLSLVSLFPVAVAALATNTIRRHTPGRHLRHSLEMTHKSDFAATVVGVMLRGRV
jgi:hypothetical protein